MPQSLSNFPFANHQTSLQPPAAMVHAVCRAEDYSYKTPGGEVRQLRRAAVPEDKVAWSAAWPDYSPVEFTAEHVREAVWADPDLDTDQDFVPKWNTLDGHVSGADTRAAYHVTVTCV